MNTKENVALVLRSCILKARYKHYETPDYAAVRNALVE